MSRRPGCAFGVSIALVIFVSLVAAGTALLTAIWPGVFELTAPLLCPDGFADPLVVRDTYSVRPGETSTTFTLYCVSPRGEVTDVGVMRPVLIVAAAVALVIGALMLVAMFGLGRRARRSGTGERDPHEEPGAGHVPVAFPDVLQVNLVEAPDSPGDRPPPP